MERAWTDLSLNSVSILTCVILDKTVNFSEAQVSFPVKVEIILYTCWRGLEITHTSHLPQHLTFGRDSITGSSYPSALPSPYTQISFLILATTLWRVMPPVLQMKKTNLQGECLVLTQAELEPGFQVQCHLHSITALTDVKISFKLLLWLSSERGCFSDKAEPVC